jgi:hypothetical protein
VGFGYFYAFLHAKAATIVVCDLLGIRNQLVEFERRLHELDKWVQEAAGKLPD